MMKAIICLITIDIYGSISSFSLSFSFDVKQEKPWWTTFPNSKWLSRIYTPLRVVFSTVISACGIVVKCGLSCLT